jgi:hypothetical protein
VLKFESGELERMRGFNVRETVFDVLNGEVKVSPGSYCDDDVNKIAKDIVNLIEECCLSDYESVCFVSKVVFKDNRMLNLPVDVKNRMSMVGFPESFRISEFSEFVETGSSYKVVGLEDDIRSIRKSII